MSDKRQRVTRVRPTMKLDVEKKIDARVLAAFDGIVPGPDAKARGEILNTVRALAGTV